MTTPVNPTDTFNQWTNAKTYFTQQVPAWLGSNTDDQDRVRAYIWYERLYWNTPGTLAVVQRGDEENPTYLPSSRKLIEACDRFLAKDWTYAIDNTAGSDTDRAAAEAVFKNFFKVQKMRAKFGRQKKYGLIRGDAIWHIWADESHPAGQRVMCQEIHPQNAFAILQDENPDMIIGWHLVDLIPDPRDETKQLVRRQTYTKATGKAYGPSIILSSVGAYELAKWDDRVMLANPKPEIDQYLQWEGTKNPFPLPDKITELPVYLIPNEKEPCQTYGSSETRGIESVIADINQTVSDQGLTLAVQGLGVYFSTAGPPVGQDGTPSTFDISPMTVVEVPEGADFGRVSGVQAGLPGIEHMNFIMGQTQSAVGVPDIAAGVVDVSVAESGIALQLQLSPMTSKNADKEQDMADEYNGMFQALLDQWFVVYEGLGSDTGVIVEQQVGSAIPQDKAARFLAVMEMAVSVPPIISVATAQEMIRELGYDIPQDEIATMAKEAQDRADAVAKAAIAADPFQQRAAAEQGAGGTGSGIPAVGVNGLPAPAGAPGR